MQQTIATAAAASFIVVIEREAASLDAYNSAIVLAELIIICG